MRTVSGALVASALIAVATLGVRADDRNTTFQIRATMIGDNEVPPIATDAKGRLNATVNTEAKTITFELTYSGLEGGDTPLFSHIHFGPPFVNGGVMVFFCDNSAVPKSPYRCPSDSTGPATVKGVITGADVQNLPAQGINGGADEFDDVVTAIRKGLSYANLHTPKFPGGEIRGKVNVRGGEDH